MLGKLKQVGIFIHPTKAVPATILNMIHVWAKDQKLSIQQESRKFGKSYADINKERQEMAKVIDLAISLGGDGTVLSTARTVAERQTPILGINIGKLGFLTEFSTAEEAEIEAFLKRDLEQGAYLLESRNMLQATVLRGQLDVKTDKALNDVTIDGGDTGSDEIVLDVDGKRMSSYKGNGVIIATPTGSTAYNLSANGPLALPDTDILLATPIMPHQLTQRPVAISNRSRIRISLGTARQGLIASWDGQEKVSLQAGDQLSVGVSNAKAVFLRRKGWDVFEVWRKKLHWDAGHKQA